MRKNIVTLILAVVLGSANAATFTVTNTAGNPIWWPANGDPGSLQRALFDANTNPGADTIKFNLPGGSTITSTGANMGSQVALIMNNVTINGLSTQDGGSIILSFTLDVTGDNNVVSGLTFTTQTNGMTITGSNNELNSNNFLNNTEYGLVLAGAAKFNIIGAISKPNIFSGNKNGIVVQDSALYNILRGNSYSCNSSSGIKLEGSGNSLFGGVHLSKIVTVNTDDMRPTFVSGTAPANATVDIYMKDTTCIKACNDSSAQGGTFLATTTADGGGNWEFDVTMTPINVSNVIVMATDTSTNNSSEFSTCTGSSVSTRNLESINEKVFPNPSTGVFNLVKAHPWVLIDSHGQTVKEGLSSSVNINQLADGFYFLKTNEEFIKLLKQN